MYKLLYAGFDTLDVAFAGALPVNALNALEKAREESSERQEPVLATIGPGKVNMHVSGYGMRGGYAYVVDTGPLGAIWRFKKNLDPREWNIFVSPRATMLLAYGYDGTRDRLWKSLAAMGARVTDHSINRADFAMDFQTHGFELHQDQFAAHSHTKVSPHWGKQDKWCDPNQPSAVLRGRQLESVTIGKQPGRQIIVYDKRREAIEKQKLFWFKAWDVDRYDPNLEVWRVEVRAGKREIKDKYQIRRFKDFEAGIGDVTVRALQDVRYLADRQGDSNVTRQEVHPLWISAQTVSVTKLIEYRSGLTPDQFIEIERDRAKELYSKLIIGNAIGYGVSVGLNNEEIVAQLPEFTAKQLGALIKDEPNQTSKAIMRCREKLHFIA